MITMHGLTKAYRTSEVETTALDAIDVQIDSGEFVGVMGPSGCGKSTFLNIVGLLDRPTSGQYLFDGTDVSNHSEGQLAKIRKGHVGFIFQSFNLIDELTVVENVEMPLLYQRVAAKERRERAMAILERVEVGHRSKHLPQQLSGGQQQRVAIARALVAAPKLILADEPTGNLDSRNGEEVMDLLTSLNAEGTTIVMVTHSQLHADYASRIINLFDGQVVSENVVRLEGERRRA